MSARDSPVEVVATPLVFRQFLFLPAFSLALPLFGSVKMGLDKLQPFLDPTLDLGERIHRVRGVNRLCHAKPDGARGLARWLLLSSLRKLWIRRN